MDHGRSIRAALIRSAGQFQSNLHDAQDDPVDIVVRLPVEQAT
jgi:hypothetical protein